MTTRLEVLFGSIDIYLFDQLLRGRIPSGARVPRLLDPLKTTVVQGQRAMTTWVVRKEG